MRTVLCILDGFGILPPGEGNAIELARKPHYDRLWAHYPHTTLEASGLAVGLPEGVMGNSEVGHTNIGAGRVIYQTVVRIDKAIANGELAHNPPLLEAMRVGRRAALHLLGLVSDGKVHSSLDHLRALLQLAKNQKVERVYLHAFLDGRDTPPRSALVYLDQVEQWIQDMGVGAIATVMGRYYAMDRDKRWDRTQKAYNALRSGQGLIARPAREAVEAAYARDESDEFVLPTVVDPEGKINDGDAVVFWNFRADRARQLTWALTNETFKGFDRGPQSRLFFVTFTQYDETLALPMAFPPENLLHGTLGELVSQRGLRQLRLAETEKYAHVTYFFSGGREEALPGEDRILIPSAKVATYDLKPEMSAPGIAEAAEQNIAKEVYDLIVINLANADMVGHTGIIPAAIQAVEAVDAAIGRVVEACSAHGAAFVLTADHGNAEEMIAPDGTPHTAHTTNPVPLIVAASRPVQLPTRGKLADVAPVIRSLQGW